jgi:hypothetical protein
MLRCDEYVQHVHVFFVCVLFPWIMSIEESTVKEAVKRRDHYHEHKIAQ